MFSGIIHHLGDVADIAVQPDGARLTVRAPTLGAVPEGASIAVSGACLTVVTAGEGTLAFDLSKETLDRTNLKSLSPGATVNLEPALRLGDPIDGHLVLGHVDGVGRVSALEPSGEGYLLRVEVPGELIRYVAVKGSITIDGVALTVVEKSGTDLSFAIIPYTFTHTHFKALTPGDPVNVEVDVLARYLESLMSADQGRQVPHD